MSPQIGQEVEMEHWRGKALLMIEVVSTAKNVEQHEHAVLAKR